MENQDNSSPNPNNYTSSNNNYVIDNDNNNVNPIYSQHASNDPSPTTPVPQIATSFGNPVDSVAGDASPSVFNGVYYRRAYSEGNFDITAAEDDGGHSGDPCNNVSTPSFEDMGAEEYELVSAFLNVDNGGSGQLMDKNDGGGGGSGSGGDKPKKSSRVLRRTTLPEELAEIWADDPKRVKRILGNRQSAARSKERKVRYMLELERRIQALQYESRNLYAQINIYERDRRGLSTENVELKLRLQAMDEQAELRDAINEALRREVETLKIGNAELKTPSGQSPLARRVPYSPSASPSTLTLQPPAHFSPLNSPSTFQTTTKHFSTLTSTPTLQPPANFSPLNSPSNLQLPAHFSSLNSPSNLQPPAHYSPLPSPSTVQTAHFSPLNSPSIVQTLTFTQAASPSTAPIPRPVAPLPPLHGSRPSILSRRLRQENLVTPTEQNDSNLMNVEGSLVSGNGSGFETT